MKPSDTESSPLGNLLKASRLQRKLRYGQIARMLCPSGDNRQISRLGQRIAKLERGNLDKQLLSKVAGALGIDDRLLSVVLREETQYRRQKHHQHVKAWNQWADEPIEPRLVVRLLPAVYSSLPLPHGIQLEQAKAYASAHAFSKHLKCCLFWNRRVCFYFNEAGELVCTAFSSPEKDLRPFMRLRK